MRPGCCGAAPPVGTVVRAVSWCVPWTEVSYAQAAIANHKGQMKAAEAAGYLLAQPPWPLPPIWPGWRRGVDTW